MAEVMVNNMDLHKSDIYVADLDTAILHTVGMESLKTVLSLLLGLRGRLAHL